MIKFYLYGDNREKKFTKLSMVDINILVESINKYERLQDMFNNIGSSHDKEEIEKQNQRLKIYNLYESLIEKIYEYKNEKMKIINKIENLKMIYGINYKDYEDEIKYEFKLFYQWLNYYDDLLNYVDENCEFVNKSIALRFINKYSLIKRNINDRKVINNVN